MLNELIKKYKPIITFLGDILVFFLSLIFILYLRYGNNGFYYQFSAHRDPFIIILILWLIIYNIFNQYTHNALKNTIQIIQGLLTTILVSFFVTILIFYIFSRFFSLTPKVNLIIFTVMFAILDMLWRYLLRCIFIKKEHQTNILIFAITPLLKVIVDYTKANPQLGYSLYLFNFDKENLLEKIQKNSISTIVINSQTLKNNASVDILYKLLPKQVEIIMFTDFYESIFNYVPLSEIEEEWFIREITKNKNIYKLIKNWFEIIMAIFGLVILSPVIFVVAILIMVTSSGPIFYKQERMGKNNRPFVLYKFRTMNVNQDGPLWTTERDNRITRLGRVLRSTHLDEIPQILNIIRGEISFVGPRPERTELVKIYGKIPYYEIRHIIKPGITGWAQLNYKASSSIDEAKKKFQYDLYYLKNRSIALDLFIIIKTIRMIFKTNK